MTTLFDFLVSAPVAAPSGCIWCATITSQPCPAHGRREQERPKATRRRWGRERRSRQDKMAAEQRLADELRAAREAWAASLTPKIQDELLGQAVTLPEGVAPVRQATAMETKP